MQEEKGDEADRLPNSAIKDMGEKMQQRQNSVNTRPGRVDMSPTAENKTLPSRPSLSRMGSSQHVLVSKQESAQSGNSQASSGSGRRIFHTTPLLIASGGSQLWGKDRDEGVCSFHSFLLLHHFLLLSEMWCDCQGKCVGVVPWRIWCCSSHFHCCGGVSGGLRKAHCQLGVFYLSCVCRWFVFCWYGRMELSASLRSAVVFLDGCETPVTCC